MKIIVCDLCDDVIKLKYDFQYCSCFNIGGRYLREDGRTVEIELKDNDSFKNSRVIGVPNGVRYGKYREGTCWVFHWYDPYLHVFCNGIRQTILKDENEDKIFNILFKEYEKYLQIKGSEKVK